MNKCKEIGRKRKVIVHSIYHHHTKVDGSRGLIQQNSRLKFKDGSNISINDRELTHKHFEKINKEILSALKV